MGFADQLERGCGEHQETLTKSKTKRLIDFDGYGDALGDIPNSTSSLRAWRRKSTLREKMCAD